LEAVIVLVIVIVIVIVIEIVIALVIEIISKRFRVPLQYKSPHTPAGVSS